MTMRYFEILVEQETATSPESNTQAPEPQQDVAPIKKSKTVKKGAGPFVFDNIKYADKSQQEDIREKFLVILKPKFPVVKVRNDTEDLNAGKKIPSIRILNALPKQEVIDLLKQNGFNLVPTNNEIQKVSGTYAGDIYTFTDSGVVFTVVIAGKRAKDDAGAQVGIQMLRPEKFGVLGREFNRASLAKEVKDKIPALFGQDPQLSSALQQLVDVALGTRKSVDKPLMDHISSRLNYISQDFGEILTPIAMTSSDEIISFSEKSNQPLIDVNVGGQPVAVKSLSGSGNSFASIIDMINKYEEDMKKDPSYTENKTMAVLKDFISKEGKTVDKLIRAAQRSEIPEAVKLNEILGSSPQNYQQLEQAVQQLVNDLKATGEENLYKKYLEKIYPASIAAGRFSKGKNPKPKPVGLPADWKKYTKSEGEQEKDQSSRSAGKKKFDANFVRAASRQLTYMLGMGFRNRVVEGENAKEMEDTLKAIMSGKNAVVAHIVINPDGTIGIKKQPFSNARFGYQYHAGTDTVDQNAPGFHYHFD